MTDATALLLNLVELDRSGGCKLEVTLPYSGWTDRRFRRLVYVDDKPAFVAYEDDLTDAGLVLNEDTSLFPYCNVWLSQRWGKDD